MSAAYRDFWRRNPELAQVMFSRPFTDFDPGASERRTSAAVRERIVAAVRRCIEADRLAGDEVDIAHALVALVQGLAAAETSRRLGTSKASVERRWKTAIDGLLAGFAP